MNKTQFLEDVQNAQNRAELKNCLNNLEKAIQEKKIQFTLEDWNEMQFAVKTRHQKVCFQKLH